MVTMGGNNPFYTGTQSATGDPAADRTHAVSSVPVATPQIPGVVIGGIPARGIRPEDYPLPGSPGEQTFRQQEAYNNAVNDSLQPWLTGDVHNVRDSAGNLIGLVTPNGNIYPTSALGNAMNQADLNRGQIYDRDTGPTLN
jgi:hypothetical protein